MKHHDPSDSAPVLSTVCLLLLISPAACTTAGKSGGGAAPQETIVAPAAPQARTPSSTSPDAPGANAAEPPTAPGTSAHANPTDMPPALRELVQTPRAAPRAPSASQSQGPGDEELKRASTAMAAKFVDALAKGDWKAAEGLLLTEKDLEGILSPGMLLILRGTLPVENEANVRRLLESFKGKTLTFEWKPGPIDLAPGGGTFRDPVSVMSGSKLYVMHEKIAVEVNLDQLVYLDTGWRIFKISTP
jgi:hypothetical protein